MQYKDILGGLILLSFSFGCGNSSTDEKTEAKTDTSLAPVGSVTTNPADTSVNPTQNVVINGQGVTTQPPVTTVATTNKGALNPEHGKPGHRCDIAVGAPLDSKPSADYKAPDTKVTTQPVTTSPITISPTTTTPAPAATTTVAPGMNPAHGQPGHRCDIAVGAPLNSKPNTTQPVSTQPPSSIITTPSIPAATAVAPGMNPAHGQPGHRCDIAVGAPLNSAPKKN